MHDDDDRLRLLILGGTTEASRLGTRLADMAGIAPILSLAGRTLHPVLPAVAVRIGGFGGIEGLIAYLREQRIQAVIDATHPFAARMSAHAVNACTHLGIPRAVYTRPPWVPEAGDRWINVPDLMAAVAALGAEPIRVFLTTGRLGLPAFRAAAQHHYVVRTIDPPAADATPPSCRTILARGPFTVEDEMALMRREAIDVLVSKNSGGRASAAKIVAARRLGLPVVMVARPTAPAGRVFTDLAEVERWIGDHVSRP